MPPPSVVQTATVLPFTHVVGLNAAVGTMHISASRPGYHFIDQDIEVRGGGNTLAIVHSAE